MDRVIEKGLALPITPCQVARRKACEASERIEVVDSRLAGGAQARLALSAARWAGEMADHRQVARRVERSIGRNHGFVLVDTLKYLTMGGRIGRAQALLGGVLQFKPIVGIRDGETHPADRPRARRRRRHGLSSWCASWLPFTSCT